MRERPCPVEGCRTWIGGELMCSRHYGYLPVSVLADLARKKSRGGIDGKAYRAACQTAIDYVNRGRRQRLHERRRDRVALVPGGSRR